MHGTPNTIELIRKELARVAALRAEVERAAALLGELEFEVPDEFLEPLERAGSSVQDETRTVGALPNFSIPV